jgi:8-oxo-dGTP pyrophosphatase MutT (NUDIX family)
MVARSENVGEVSGRQVSSGRLDNSADLVKEGVGCLIYSRKTKRYLFLLRDGSKYAGSWALAGGKINPGERITEALYREVQEEISTDLSQFKTIPIETFTSDNHKFVYYTFLISVENEFVPQLNNEHRGYCWVNLEDHPRPLHPGVWRTFKFRVIVDKINTLEKVL